MERERCLSSGSSISRHLLAGLLIESRFITQKSAMSSFSIVFFNRFAWADLVLNYLVVG